MNPLSVSRNDYRKNKKNSTIYTPVGVAQFCSTFCNVARSDGPKLMFEPTAYAMTGQITG